MHENLNDGPEPAAAADDAGGFGDMASEELLTEAPAPEETVSVAKDVIDATADDLDDGLFDEDPPSATFEEPANTSTAPDIAGNDAKYRRLEALRFALDNNKGRSLGADQIIEEASMFADFVEHGYDA